MVQRAEVVAHSFQELGQLLNISDGRQNREPITIEKFMELSPKHKFRRAHEAHRQKHPNATFFKQVATREVLEMDPEERWFDRLSNKCLSIRKIDIV